jgi:hypothetical protein
MSETNELVTKRFGDLRVGDQILWVGADASVATVTGVHGESLDAGGQPVLAVGIVWLTDGVSYRHELRWLLEVPTNVYPTVDLVTRQRVDSTFTTRPDPGVYQAARARLARRSS